MLLRVQTLLSAGRVRCARRTVEDWACGHVRRGKTGRWVRPLVPGFQGWIVAHSPVHSIPGNLAPSPASVHSGHTRAAEIHAFKALIHIS